MSSVLEGTDTLLTESGGEKRSSWPGRKCRRRVQQEVIEKQRGQQERQRHKADNQAIRQQIEGEELTATAKRREILQNTNELMETARLRDERLKEIKGRNLRELGATGLSEKYCVEVEGKAQTCITSSFRDLLDV
ncbi:cilia- and flagella-associated protein 45-like [Brachyistius frenatus]|uniref:cilia- and flagella-associated protein 45-like n=1 Tax=Brachyistius frenatus TaxID=100188 RepID=UPI0037E964B4